MAAFNIPEDSFGSNPLVQAMGNALGMGGLFETKQASTNLQPPPVPISETERVRDSRNARQSYPTNGGRGLGPGANKGAVNPQMPGVMDPSVLTSPETQQVLAPYGITPQHLQDVANQANPNMFVQNPEAYQKHPVIAGMLERGLEGLAFTQGSHTWGEGLSNVAKGMMDAHAARTEKYNNMLMMPFQQAQQVAQMKGIGLQQNLEGEQQRYEQSHERYFDALGDYRGMMGDIQQGKLDLAKNQQQMKQTLGLISAIQKTPLDAQGQQEWDAAIKDANGNPFAADPDKLSQIFSEASTRTEALKQGNANYRAQVAGVSRVSSSGVAAGAHLDDAQLAGLQKDYDDAQKGLAEFNKMLAGGMTATDKNGNVVYAGSDAANKAAKEYQDSVNAASSALNAAYGNIGLSSNPAQRLGPSTGVVSKPQAQKKIPRYNPATGKIE